MFTQDIDTSITIQANPEDIWKTLLDLEAYEDWNPMLRNVQTGLAIGDAVSFEVLRDDKKPLKLNARITLREEDKALSWKGGNSLLLSGHHYCRIEKAENGQCRFYHGERFTGLLLPLLRPILRDAPAQYEAMNDALKARLEAGG